MAIQTQEYARIGDDSGFCVFSFRVNDANGSITRLHAVNGMSRPVLAEVYDTQLQQGDSEIVPAGGEIDRNIGGLGYDAAFDGELWQPPDHVWLRARTV